MQPAKPLGSGDAGKSLKRPPNAYALFVKDQYSAVLRRLPECSHDMASVSRYAPLWSCLAHTMRFQALGALFLTCSRAIQQQPYIVLLPAW